MVGVDLDRRVVHLRRGDALEVLPYDHLVLALGAVPNFRDLPGVAANALTLATLEDARRLRDHVLGRPSRPTTSPTRPSGGAGSPSSWPAAASPAPRPWPACSTWFTACCATSPTSGPASPASSWSTPRERILPELGDRLAGYASGKLVARGIELRLGVTVADAPMPTASCSATASSWPPAP